MKKAKASACPKIAAAKAEGKLLRQAIIEQLLKAGPQSAAEVAGALDRDFSMVRAQLYRMVKAGVAKSERGTDRLRNSIFSLGGQTIVVRNVGKPHRPVLKEWELNLKRDVLHCYLFGMPCAGVAT